MNGNAILVLSLTSCLTLVKEYNLYAAGLGKIHV